MRELRTWRRSLRRWRVIVAASAALWLGGCASGSWIASISDEELPLDEAPPAPYPTAVRAVPSESAEGVLAPLSSESRSTSKTESVGKPVATADEVPADVATPAEPLAKESPPSIPIRSPLATPMAFVPSPLRMNRAPNPMPVQMPPANSSPAVSAPATPAPSAALPGEGQPALPPAAEPAQPLEAGTANILASSVPVAAPIVSPQEIQATAPAATLAATEPPPQQADPSASAILEKTPTTQTSPEQSPEDRLAAITQQRDVLIAMLEEEIRGRQAQSGGDLELTRLEQELRLLYATARRTDDAVRAVDSLNASEREAYKHLMFGLSTWLTEEAHRAPLRNARVMRSLRESSHELAAASKLELRNLAFCERVESFGWFTEFARNDFFPKQQVILYVEVNNFVALEKTPTSFETELQGHYQIFDMRGNIVAERKLPPDLELCRNYRRDYFLAYPIYMPDGLAAGQYRLELTVEDLKATQDYQGRKFGEGMIEFSIRN